jgi:hypothetical protein
MEVLAEAVQVQAKVVAASSTVKLLFECAQMSENNILECGLSLLGILEIDWTYGMTRTSGMNPGQPDGRQAQQMSSC